MNGLQVARLLTYVTGLVNQDLLLKNEYLATEKCILRSHLPKRLRHSNAKRSTLAEIHKRPGRQLLDQGSFDYAQES
jgi:putative transposase